MKRFLILNRFIHTAPTATTMDLQLTEKEAKALEDMLQHYREFQEEVYGYPDDPDSLFTEAQRRVFARFDVISIRKGS